MKVVGALGGWAQGQDSPLSELSRPQAFSLGLSHTVHGLSEDKQLSSFLEWAELSDKAVSHPRPPCLYGHSVRAWARSGWCS